MGSAADGDGIQVLMTSGECLQCILPRCALSATRDQTNLDSVIGILIITITF